MLPEAGGQFNKYRRPGQYITTEKPGQFALTQKEPCGIIDGNRVQADRPASLQAGKPGGT
jgi:hypothetical protein